MKVVFFGASRFGLRCLQLILNMPQAAHIAMDVGTEEIYFV